MMMPRPKGKSLRIAYAILGKPLNMRNKRGKQKSIDKKTVYDDTMRLR